MLAHTPAPYADSGAVPGNERWLLIFARANPATFIDTPWVPANGTPTRIRATAHYRPAVAFGVRYVLATGNAATYYSMTSATGVRATVGGSSRTPAATVINTGEQVWELEWDGAGLFWSRLDAAENGPYPTGATAPTAFRIGFIGNWWETWEGWIRDVEVYESSTLTHKWAIDDNVADGGTIVDSVGSANGTLQLGSGSWVYQDPSDPYP